MTTFQTQQHTSHIGLPVSEDPMEVTNDVDRHFEGGEDIDIDLDLTGDVQRDEEDDYMGQDDEETIDTALVGEQYSNTTNDDEMADGAYVEGSVAGRSSVQDEDLEDADLESGINEDIIKDFAVENPSDPLSDLLDDEEHVDAGGLHYNEHDNHEFNVATRGDQDYHEQLGSYESDEDAPGEMLPNGQKEAPNISHDESGLTNQEPPLKDYEGSSNRQEGTLDETDPAIHEFSQQGHDEYHGEHHEYRHHGTEETVGTPPQASEHATSSRTEEAEIAAPAREKSASLSNVDPETCSHNRPVASDGAFAAESIHVHPVVVIYQENEISLFPPVNQEEDEEDEEQRSLTFFLDDEQLASGSMQNLLGAFRSVLGESINEQDELTIDIEELGLHISEFSTDCSTISLSEMIDIYIQLQHYDGLDSPPPLYMNLTTKARFSHRLEYLLVAIAEKRGLSQTRSSYAAEESQQLEAEGEPVGQAGDELLQADVVPGRKDKTSVASQDEDAGDSHGDGISQNGPIALSSLLDNSKPPPSPLKANASADNTETGNDEAFTDTTNRGNDSAVGDGPHSEVPSTNLAKTAPQLVPPTESERHGLGESIVDDDDFIDYEDDGEPAQGTSCGSSTLQGDSFDVTADGNIDHSVKDISQEEPAEPQGTEIIRKRTAKGEQVTHDTLHDENNDPITERRAKEQPDFVDHHTEYLEYFGKEDNAASSDERFGRRENSRDIEQSSQLQNHEISPAEKINGSQEEGFKRSQHESAPFQADVAQELQTMVNDGHDNVERTQLDNEQGLEHQSNTNQNDVEKSGAVLWNDDHKGETDDGHVNTELAESKLAPPMSNGDIVDDFTPIAKTELQLSVDGRRHSQDDDDDDEITYEDEILEEHTSTDTLPAERKSVPSPGSLKRARSFYKDNDAIEDDLQDAKRIRSF